MNSLYTTSIVIFRRDLRTIDNTAFNAAIARSKQIIPCFILDPRQVGEENAYRSTNGMQFMIESLQDLDAQLRTLGGQLYIFYGTPHEIIEKVAATNNIDAVFFNKDYTPFSLERDKQIEHTCNRHHISCNAYDDALLNKPEDILTQGGTPYAVFSAFYKKSLQKMVRPPEPINKPRFYTGPLANACDHTIYTSLMPITNPHIHLHGGRTRALELIKALPQQHDYFLTRDIPAQPTSYLSAHLKFGTLSVREAYYAIKDALGATHPLLRQLYWRDFFTHVAYHSPFVFGHAYQQKYDHLAWEHNKEKFNRWCTGTTGFPLVDAGMRQLNTTGYMHNRVRMVVASFLTKDLRIDWRWGERYFAQQLIDYDPALNNGNWQWCASTGCDAQPYFRIFNPWLQQKKFDPECVYIKRWLPELSKLSATIIHTWHKEKHAAMAQYPKTMVDHAQESRLTKQWFIAQQNLV